MITAPKNFAVNTVLVFTIVLVLGEVITRFFITSTNIVVQDPDIGWIYKANQTIFHTKEGWGENTINNYGFNDRNYPTTRYTHRIVVLGDSYTEAFHIGRDKNFTTLIENYLPCADVQNIGRSGLSPVHYPALSKKMLTTFPQKTDLQVIVLTPGDYKELQSTDAKISFEESTGEVTNIKLKEYKPHWLREKTALIFENSALATFIKERVRLLSKSKTPPKETNKPLTKNNKQTSPEPTDKTKNILKYVFSEVRSQSPLLLVYIPRIFYYPNNQYVHAKYSYEFENLIREVATDLNIPFISTYNELGNSYQRNQQPPVGFANYNISKGHLNERGHTAVANAILQKIDQTCITPTLTAMESDTRMIRP